MKQLQQLTFSAVLLGALLCSPTDAKAEPRRWVQSNRSCDDHGYYHNNANHNYYHGGYNYGGYSGANTSGQWNSWNQWNPRPRNSYYQSSYGDRAIQNGIRTGQLSNREADELRDKLSDIRSEQSSYWSDGRLSTRESNDLRHDYGKFERDLNHELNDGERRTSYYRDDSYGWRW